MKKIYWNADLTPVETTLDRLVYELRKEDAGLIFDAVTMTDIYEDSDGMMPTLDALISPFAKLDLKMSALQKVMERAGGTIQPLKFTISEPFVLRNTANVAVIFELSDGQTVSIFLRNADVINPKKIVPADDMLSWKWMLNKKDCTVAVAPETGTDLDLRKVAARIMKLAEKNSALFAKGHAKRTEQAKAVEYLKVEVNDLEAELKAAQHRLEIAKVEKDDRDIAAITNPVVEPEIIDPTPEPTPIEIEPTLNGFSVAETINELNTDYGTNNDVWNATVSEVQALSDSDYEQLIDALENSNYHNQYYAVQALRKGNAELAGEFNTLLNDQVKAGQLTPELRIRREELVAKLEGETVPVEPELHYSEIILNDLVANYGWGYGARGFIKKNVGGGSIGGQLNPDGGVVVNATFNENGRYLMLQSGFDDVLSVDCRGDSAEKAKEFDDAVTDWAIKNAVNPASLNVSRAVETAPIEVEIAKVEKDDRDIAAITNPVVEPEIVEPTPKENHDDGQPYDISSYNGYATYTIMNKFYDRESDGVVKRESFYAQNHESKLKGGSASTATDFRMFKTKEEAISYIDQAQKEYEDAAAKKESDAAMEVENANKLAEKMADDINGFLAEKDEKTKALIRKSLDKAYKIDDEIVGTREFIDKKHASGELKIWTREENVIKDMTRAAYNRAINGQQEAHEKRQREAGTKTVYIVNGYQFGKIPYDYAAYLLAKSGVSNTESTVETGNEITPIEPVEPKLHYSEIILNDLVANYGWEQGTTGMISKNVGGASTGGAMNPNGDSIITAGFYDKGNRYLTMYSGFDTILDIDCRGDSAEKAKEFDDAVTDWAIKNAVNPASLNVSKAAETALEEPVNEISLTGKELGDFDDTEEGKEALQKAGKSFLKSLRGEWIDCPALKNKVEIRKRGIKETTSFFANPKKIKLAPALKSIIETASFGEKQPNHKPDKKPDVVAYYKIKNKVNLDGENLNVSVLIEEDSNGLLHYDYMIDAVEDVSFDDVSLSKRSQNHKSWHLDSSTSTEIISEKIEQSSRMIFNLFIEDEESESVEPQPTENTIAPESESAQGIDPVALENINAANLSDAIKKKAIAYLNENPTTHTFEGSGLSKKSQDSIMESIKAALFAEIKAAIPELTEGWNANGFDDSVNLFHTSLDGKKFLPITIKVSQDDKSLTGYRLSFITNMTGDKGDTKNLFDSTETLEDLKSWGFALPFDLDVKAFVANVIKPVVDEFLSKQAGSEAEQPSNNQTKEYRYAMVNRPAGLSTVPKGFIRLEERPSAGLPHYAAARNGVVVYDRKLTDDETKKYEMSPMVDGDVLHEYADNIANEMKKYASQYVKLANNDIADFIDKVKNRLSESSAGFRPSIGDINHLAELVKNKLSDAITGKPEVIEPQAVEPETINPQPDATGNSDIDSEIESLKQLIGTPEFSDALDALLDKLEAARLESQYESIVSDIINQDAQAESAKVGG